MCGKGTVSVKPRFGNLARRLPFFLIFFTSQAQAQALAEISRMIEYYTSPPML